MSLNITLRPTSAEAHRAADLARHLVRAMKIDLVEYEQAMFAEAMEEKESEPFFRLLEEVVPEAMNDVNFTANLLASFAWLVKLTMQVGFRQADRLDPGAVTSTDRVRTEQLLDLVAELTAKNGFAYVW